MLLLQKTAAGILLPKGPPKANSDAHFGEVGTVTSRSLSGDQQITEWGQQQLKNQHKQLSGKWTLGAGCAAQCAAVCIRQQSGRTPVY
jgi:hypothetical protein